MATEHGRSERSAESYSWLYGELLSDGRIAVVGFLHPARPPSADEYIGEGGVGEAADSYAGSSA